VILSGSGKENIEFKYMNDRGDTSVRRHPFEGVLHNMERRYKETNPARYAKSWRSLSATAPAPPATEPVCAVKRATSLLKIPRCRPSRI
jgi:excinuclease UvrABC ATPase subunit